MNLILISGEPGIGKTRLCEELVDRAAGCGVRVAWARCWGAGSVPAFWSWEQLLTPWPSISDIAPATTRR